MRRGECRYVVCPELCLWLWYGRFGASVVQSSGWIEQTRWIPRGTERTSCAWGGAWLGVFVALISTHFSAAERMRGEV